jgi:hypothetical protein
MIAGSKDKRRIIRGVAGMDDTREREVEDGGRWSVNSCCTSAGRSVDNEQQADINTVGGKGLMPTTFCIRDRWSRGDAWMGCWERGIVDDLQTFEGSHKWAMVYERQNSELWTGVRYLMRAGFESLRVELAGLEPQTF